MESRAIITRMIPRWLESGIIARLKQFPAVALLGPRQVGKTTLARKIRQDKSTIYLDLELVSTQQKPAPLFGATISFALI